MKTGFISTAVLALLIVGVTAETNRKLLQTILAGQGSSLTVSADSPIVNAITITLTIPYPQNAYFCNVTGDSRIPQEGPFPLQVRVPVGVEATVIFANITGPIPGTSCSAVQQPGGTAVVQQKASTSVQQMVDNPSSVVQQTAGGSSVVQQQYASSVNQQQSNPDAYFNCASGTSVVQQPGGTSVVQQPGGTSVVQQPGSGTSVVQQPGSGTSVVQQPGGSSVVQQPGGSSVVQQPGSGTSVVQQPGGTSVVQQPSGTSVVQQPGGASSVVQQQGSGSSVVQQPGESSVVQQGRKLLQVGTIEYISNNGSTGQPQLSVLDTVEGVPNISFKPTAAGQTAQFNGGLQVAVTTTNDGFGTPYIPYRVDARLSPQCAVQVNFVGI